MKTNDKINAGDFSIDFLSLCKFWTMRYLFINSNIKFIGQFSLVHTYIKIVIMSVLHKDTLTYRGVLCINLKYKSNWIKLKSLNCGSKKLLLLKFKCSIFVVWQFFQRQPDTDTKWMKCFTSVFHLHSDNFTWNYSKGWSARSIQTFKSPMEQQDD